MQIRSFSTATRLKIRGIILLSALILPALFLLPVIDRDEARFAQASKQMLETGNYIAINFQNTPRHKKPAAPYWAQATSTALLAKDHTNIAPYRLPSFIAVLASFLILFRIARRMMDEKTAFVAALTFCFNPITLTQAVQARADALLLLSALIAFDALHALWQSASTKEAPPRKTCLIFWGALGASLLIKGPILLAALLASLAWLGVFAREKTAPLIAHLAPLKGVPLALIIAAPWYVLIQFEGGSNSFIKTALWEDFWPKITAAQESHGAPPGFYLLVLGLSAFALIAPHPLGLVKFFRTHARKTNITFLIAWLVPSWITFELVPTKLPHYTLFLMPAFYLGVFCFFAQKESANISRRAYFAIGIWLALLAGLLLALAPLSLAKANIQNAPLPLGLFIASLFCLLIIGRFTYKRRPPARVALYASGFCALTLSGALSLSLPHQKPLWLAQTMKETLSAEKRAPNTPIGVQGFSEPSAVFLLGTDIAVEPATHDMVRLIRQSKQGYLFCAEIDFCQKVQQTLGTGFRSHIVDKFSGINYSQNRPLTLTLFKFEATK